MRFLHDYGGVTPQPGDFVDETGRVLGRHRGLECYTAGQRKGLGVSADRPLYVISKNAENNTVLLGDNEELFSAALLASRVNWIAGETPAEKSIAPPKRATARKSATPSSHRWKEAARTSSSSRPSAPSRQDRPSSSMMAKRSSAAARSKRRYKSEKRLRESGAFWHIIVR